MIDFISPEKVMTKNQHFSWLYDCFVHKGKCWKLWMCQWHNWLPLQLCSVSCTNSFVLYKKLFKLLHKLSTNDILVLIWNFLLRGIDQLIAIGISDIISKIRHYIISSQWSVSLEGITCYCLWNTLILINAMIDFHQRKFSNLMEINLPGWQGLKH